MKKALKVILYFFGSFILLILLLLIFHNSLISYTLKTIINNKSGGQVHLEMSDFDLNLREGSIVIIKPELVLHEIFLDSTQNISIDRISFDKIEIDKLDLKVLVKERNIEAAKFFINRPQFWFTEMGKDTKSSFHPDQLFEALNHNPGLFKTLQVHIEDIEITYGSINIAKSAIPEADPGLVDFTILLRDFNSNAPQDSLENRILFSQEVLFKLKNLNRTLKSGYVLNLDSAIFNSTKRDMLLGGVSLLPGIKNKGKNGIALVAGKLLLNDIGLEEVRGLEDLSIRAIQLADGSLSTFRYEEAKEKKEKTDSDGIEQLKQIFGDFKIDSVEINRFDFFDVVKGVDTSIAAKNINFLMTGIEIDSTMFEDPFRYFHYDTIKFRTASLQLNKIIDGVYLKYNNLQYSNFDRNLKVARLLVEKDSTEKTPGTFNVSLRELDVKGFSLKRFQKKQTQRLSVKLLDPEINLVVIQKENQQKQKPKDPLLPKHLVLEKVIVENANLNLSANKETEVAIKGIDIDVEEFYFPDKVDSNFRYQSLSFNYDNLVAQIENNRISLVTDALSYEDKELLVKKVNSVFAQAKDLDPIRFRAKSIALNVFDLEKLLFEDKLILANFQVNQPVVSGEFKIPSKSKNINKNEDPGNPNIPFGFDIGGLTINQGKFDAVIDVHGNPLHISTTYGINIGEVKGAENDSLTDLLEQLQWGLNLHKTNINFQNHDLQFKHLASDTYASNFRLDSLSIESTRDFDTNYSKLNFRDLDLSVLNISGLNYNLLLTNDSIDFNSFIMDGLNVDLVLPKTKHAEQVDPNRKLDIKPYLIFSYDTVSFTNLKFNIEQPGDTSYGYIRFQDVSMKHQKQDASGINLARNIDFKFESFSFVDSLANKYLLIDKGYADPVKMEFTIDGVEGSNLMSGAQDSLDLKSSIVFNSSEIKFSNIFIEDQLPSKVKVGKLYMEDLDVDLQAANKPTVDTAEKTEFNINLEVLRRFSKIITKLEVDTTDLNDISMRYRNVNDTAVNLFKMDSVAFIVHAINIDTNMIGESEPQLIQRLSLDLRGKTHITKDSLYEIKSGRIYYDFPAHQISVDSLYVTPRYPDSLFFDKAVYQTDRLRLFGEKIEVNNIKIDDVINNDFLHLGNIVMKGFDISMYRDKRKEMRPGISPKFPREALMSIKHQFIVDTVHMVDSKLKYKEFDLKSEKPGEIYFTDFDVKAFNLTNMIAEDDRQSKIKVDLNAKIMGEAAMNASVFFPLYKDSIVYWLEGSTEEIDLVALNSMTENLLGLGILRGRGSVDIPLITANDSIAYGSLTFKYKKLKVAIYNRKKEQIRDNFLFNFLINDLVVRSNNPKRFRKAKVGASYFERDPQKGIVNYVWKGVLSGLLSTLGFNTKDQRQEKKQLNK